ncbi:MAG: hypothetical protein ACRC5T_12505 [Cetobacterium sp.]
MAISEFQSRNKYLTLNLGNQKLQFKPIIGKDGVESLNGVLTGEFKPAEVKAILTFDGILKTK